MKILISIEGNIGVGKTSLINLLQKTMSDIAEFILEPVEEWINIRDENGKNLLETFYNDKLRWSYTFQNIAYITRMDKIISMIENSEKKIIILDRSLEADLNTFAKMLYDEKFINEIEWNAYNKWNNFFNKHFGNKFKHKIIYLRCSPNISLERIKIRNRESEKNISFEYLQLVHNYHESWLFNNSNVLIIDADKDFVNNVQNFSFILENINKFV